MTSLTVREPEGHSSRIWQFTKNEKLTTKNCRSAVRQPCTIPSLSSGHLPFAARNVPPQRAVDVGLVAAAAISAISSAVGLSTELFTESPFLFRHPPERHIVALLLEYILSVKTISVPVPLGRPHIQLAGNHVRGQAACSVGAPLVGALPCSVACRQRTGPLAPTEQTALRPGPVPPFHEAKPPLRILFRPALLLL